MLPTGANIAAQEATSARASSQPSFPGSERGRACTGVQGSHKVAARMRISRQVVGQLGRPQSRHSARSPLSGKRMGAHLQPCVTLRQLGRAQCDFPGALGASR